MVFAIAGHLLHNYLLPRDCPRVTFYANAHTTPHDRNRFLGSSSATHVIAIETAWFHRINTTILYDYEFPILTFTLLDETAGYYISYKPVTPVAVRRIDNIFDELLSLPHIELRILPELWSLGNAAVASTLSYSLIRMRNATSQSPADPAPQSHSSEGPASQSRSSVGPAPQSHPPAGPVF